MCMKISEMMHGAVLNRISKNNPSNTLTMIETSDESRNMYRINDDVVIYTKYSKTLKTRTEGKRVIRKWQFTFMPETLDELQRIRLLDSTYIVLVCADIDNFTQGELCLLKPEEIRKCLDFSDITKQQTVFVEAKQGSMLRVYQSNKDEPLKIARNALNKWKIPGR